MASQPPEKLAHKFLLHPHFFVDHLPFSYEYAMEKTDIWAGSHREDMGTILREIKDLKRSHDEAGIGNLDLDAIKNAMVSLQKQVEEQGTAIKSLHSMMRGQTATKPNHMMRKGQR